MEKFVDGYKLVNGEKCTFLYEFDDGIRRLIKDAIIVVTPRGAYICTNEKELDGLPISTEADKLGYKYSWAIFGGLKYNDILNFRSKSNTRVFDGRTVYHGQPVICTIEDDDITNGKISFDRLERDVVYICQNIKEGDSTSYRFGYDYSWIARDTFEHNGVINVILENARTGDSVIGRQIPNSTGIKPRNIRKIITKRVLPKI